MFLLSGVLLETIGKAPIAAFEKGLSYAPCITYVVFYNNRITILILEKVSQRQAVLAAFMPWVLQQKINKLFQVSLGNRACTGSFFNDKSVSDGNRFYLTSGEDAGISREGSVKLRKV